MGPKITIDSATLMNKGLEVIEAHYLFDLEYSSIHVLIHPEGMVHAMAEFRDGSLRAEMATPDMRLPIQLAMAWPERLPTGVEPVPLTERPLTFEPVDREAFPAVDLAYRVGGLGLDVPGRDERRQRGRRDGVPRREDPAHTHRGARADRRRRARAGLGGLDREHRACRRLGAAARRRDRRGAVALPPMDLLLGALIFLPFLTVIIAIHELGHFYFARRFRMKVTEYFVGFGPWKIWSRRKGELEYGVKPIFIGGYVKIAGMNPYEENPPEDAPRLYGAKPIWQRAITIFAGPGTHFVVAAIIFAVWLMAFGDPRTAPLTPLVIDEVETTLNGDASPAAAAGLVAGDRIVRLDRRVGSDVGAAHGDRDLAGRGRARRAARGGGRPRR